MRGSDCVCACGIVHLDAGSGTGHPYNPGRIATLALGVSAWGGGAAAHVFGLQPVCAKQHEVEAAGQWFQQFCLIKACFHTSRVQVRLQQ